jgi:integrase
MNIVDLNMRLFKRKNGIWYAELGRDRWRSLKTKDEAEAHRGFKVLQNEALKGKLTLIEKENNITLGIFLPEYLKHLAVISDSAFTYERVDRICSKLLDCLKRNTPLRSLSAKDADTYITYCRKRKKKNSNVTINLEMRHIKAAFSYAVTLKYLKENPFTGVKQLKENKGTPQFIEETDDVQKVFSAIEKARTLSTRKRYRLAFALYVYTGARRSEIWKLEWRDIKDKVVVYRDRKNDELLEVPILPQLASILAEYQRKDIGCIFHDITRDQLGRAMKHFLREAGLGRLKPHDLRHTFASHLIMSGVPIEVVAKLLGQSSLHATKIYIHLTDKCKAEAITKLPY